MYDRLRVFGENIVTTEGMVWKRHRQGGREGWREGGGVCFGFSAIGEGANEKWDNVTPVPPASLTYPSLPVFLRLVARAAFSEANNRLVFETVKECVGGMMDAWERQREGGKEGEEGREEGFRVTLMEDITQVRRGEGGREGGREGREGGKGG